VRLKIAIIEKVGPTGSTTGPTLRTKMLTLCADCALERFEKAIA
jgi:hypothetical protein